MQALTKPARYVLDECFMKAWRAMPMQSMHLNWFDACSTSARQASFIV